MRRLAAMIGMAAFLALILVGCNWVSCDSGKCVGTSGPDLIEGTSGADYKLIALEGCDAVFGRSGDDKLYGDKGDDIVVGNEGHDSLYGGPGDDALGEDDVYDSGDEPISDLTFEIEACVSGSDSGSRSLALGSDATLPSGTPVEELGVQGGKDKLYGGSGSDELYAADGDKDLVDCGPGKDRAFVDEGLDKVVNCEAINPIL